MRNGIIRNDVVYSLSKDLMSCIKRQPMAVTISVWIFMKCWKRWDSGICIRYPCPRAHGKLVTPLSRLTKQLIKTPLSIYRISTNYDHSYLAKIYWKYSVSVISTSVESIVERRAFWRVSWMPANTQMDALARSFKISNILKTQSIKK